MATNSIATTWAIAWMSMRNCFRLRGDFEKVHRITPMERATSDVPEKAFCVHFALKTLRYKQSLKACTECPKPKIDLDTLYAQKT